MPQDFPQLFKGFLVLILGGHVDFGEYNEEGDFQEEAKPDMLLSHLLYAHVCSDDHTAKVRGEPCEPVDGSFEVFLMSTEINQ